MKVTDRYTLPRAARILRVPLADLERLAEERAVVAEQHCGEDVLDFQALSTLRRARAEPLSGAVVDVAVAARSPAPVAELVPRIVARAAATRFIVAAEALAGAGRLSEAAEAYQAASAADPRHPEPLLGVGRVRLEEGRWDEAEAAFRQAAVLAPNRANRLIVLTGLFRTGDTVSLLGAPPAE